MIETNEKDNRMLDVKNIILEANEHIKAAAKLFESLYKNMDLDPALSQNAVMAFSELIKCIKHLALMQGDITGKELATDEMRSPPEEVPAIAETVN